MNKRTISLLVVIAIPTLLAGILLGRFAFPENTSETESSATESSSKTPPATTLWTCSMHPQIQQPEPGSCPICGMDLIPVEKDSDTEVGPREMSMSDASRALADIQTTVVTQEYPEAEIRLVGKLEYAETHEKSLTARFPARIDELFVNYTGIPVQKGEHLAKVYSPELLTAQSEYLSSYRVDPDSSITRAARQKLELWGLLPEQIEAILESETAEDHFSLKAPVGGVVVAKNVKEGDYVQTGEPLFKIVDLSVLWAYLDAYESDLPWLKFGQDVTFTVESFPGQTFHGRISFINPEVDRKTRTIPIRVNVPNPDGQLKPGMFVRGVVASRIAKDGQVYVPELAGKWISPMHPEIIKDGPGQCDVCGMDLVPAEELGYVADESKPAPLVVPTSAVLRTGKRAVVYVEKPDAERPTFEGREIVLGPRAGKFYLVADGLEAGETVVTHGAFKIDSALQIQAKPSMMSASTIPEPEATSSADVGETAIAILPSYFALQAALANDDLVGSQAALKEMMATTGHTGEIPELIHKMLAEEDLAGIRRPHFETLSNVLIAAVKDHPEAFTGQIYQMHCPMVYNDRGADWLQPTDKLLNPYFGSMMLHCGEVVGEIGTGARGEGRRARGENTNTANSGNTHQEPHQ
ncbi:efflux RND transporter periplasmic adaptor subunit [Puniceicoccus vermicola]|uniref:Efflux RND transporter periplasmic adaptor subunit n=1 Tax=Puniceicoccus vermicola TaxID=388746 RepID=A0A7X1B1H8_9BACT|nr:efflux RND transporter periplasmic adaptor subunit [Puniceicoccus vermicola]MBC2603837.1 efflux RND transporter periplasmic adaptor subunit [Puniceicoccus vermicola]